MGRPAHSPTPGRLRAPVQLRDPQGTAPRLQYLRARQRYKGRKGQKSQENERGRNKRQRQVNARRPGRHSRRRQNAVSRPRLRPRGPHSPQNYATGRRHRRGHILLLRRRRDYKAIKACTSKKHHVAPRLTTSKPGQGKQPPKPSPSRTSSSPQMSRWGPNIPPRICCCRAALGCGHWREGSPSQLSALRCRLRPLSIKASLFIYQEGTIILASIFSISFFA